MDDDTTIESARPKQGCVQHIWAVGRRQNDDALARAEPVHLREDLVERLLLLRMRAAHETGAARPPYGIQLIDEDNRWSCLTSLAEQIAYATGANAHNHL